MSSSDAVSETLDEGTNAAADRVGSLAESVAPRLARHAGSGNLAAASAVVSLVRAGRTFLKGNRKRGLLQALAGLFWVGVALAQRRSGGAGRGRSRTDVAEVADTSPDVEDAVEPGGREVDHATGEEVVDTTDADIDEADTAPEVEASPDVARDVDEGDVDQRDVAGGTDVEDAADADEGETESASDSDPAATENDESASESDDRVETTSGE